MTRKALPPVGYSIRHLILLAGGEEVVSRACGLARIQWDRVIPTKHVMKMSKLTELPLLTLRPDLAPETVASAGQEPVSDAE